MKGTVKWYNPRKGYGFIQGEDGKDIFVHRSAIPDGTYINEGDKVEYEIVESEIIPCIDKILITKKYEEHHVVIKHNDGKFTRMRMIKNTFKTEELIEHKTLEAILVPKENVKITIVDYEDFNRVDE